MDNELLVKPSESHKHWERAAVAESKTVCSIRADVSMVENYRGTVVKEGAVLQPSRYVVQESKIKLDISNSKTF